MAGAVAAGAEVAGAEVGGVEVGGVVAAGAGAFLLAGAALAGAALAGAELAGTALAGAALAGAALAGDEEAGVVPAGAGWATGAPWLGLAAEVPAPEAFGTAGWARAGLNPVSAAAHKLISTWAGTEPVERKPAICKITVRPGRM